ncbi:hypothetical protein RB595_000748 [Gaeumannomyces hyphopodioides]
MTSNTPMEDAIREKVGCFTLHSWPRFLFTLEKPGYVLVESQVTAAFQPSRLEIHNDSHLHAHHKAMKGSTSRETHFRLVITSDQFKSKTQPSRHRAIYALLKEEMAREGGIHALQLKTMTPEEEERQRQKETEASG